ncbi:hypothetical protein [Cerasicoccus maritimus]|uniref:hypothetical protein n=1 Tax=Cerasicoccus maritimus TaxID=490089 RepID=UPI002852C310|nr:hypothetical protein [Cerasicoccus maritimus]
MNIKLLMFVLGVTTGALLSALLFRERSIPDKISKFSNESVVDKRILFEEFSQSAEGMMFMMAVLGDDGCSVEDRKMALSGILNTSFVYNGAYLSTAHATLDSEDSIRAETIGILSNKYYVLHGSLLNIIFKSAYYENDPGIKGDKISFIALLIGRDDQFIWKLLNGYSDDVDVGVYLEEYYLSKSKGTD